MSLLRQVVYGLRALTRRASVDEELDEEIRDYFERARAERAHEGLSPERAARAARAARRELGDALRAREALRSYGWENIVETVYGDVRYALRRLRRAPEFTAVAVLTLALGVGASTAVFSAIYPILLAPLPYPDADRVVRLQDYDPAGAPFDVTYGTFVELAARSRSFEGLAVADHWRPALVGTAEPERLDGDRVSAGYFGVLGVAPARGRDFVAADAIRGAAPVVIVSESLARRRFGGAGAALDRPIVLDGYQYTVVGVMPARFENALAPDAEVWTPLWYRDRAPFQSGEWGHHLRMIGRLAGGVSVDQARRETQAIGRSPSSDFPRPAWASLRHGLSVESLQSSVTSDVRPALLAVLAAVLLLLAIACVNATNLLLARGVERREELAMRATLGAGRGRLVRQLLTEGLLLALLGGAAGLGVAAAGVRALLAVAPGGLPRLASIRLDTTAFLFALATTTVVGVGVGLIPALRSARGMLLAAGRTGARAAGTHEAHLLRRAMVATQVALALVLLIGAGLLLRSVERLLATAPGFDASHVLTMQIVASGRRFGSNEEAFQFFERVLDAARSVPGVVDAALTSQVPLSGDFDVYGVAFESLPRSDPTGGEGAFRYVVTPDWFRTMRIPLVEGRLLGSEDRPGAPESVLISESFAKRRFGDRSPIGQRVRIGPEVGNTDRPWDLVVGVVGDVKQASLALGPPDAFYVAMGQWSWVDSVQSLVVRARGDAAALAPAVKRAIWSVEPTPPIERVATMDDLLAASEAQRRFALGVFTGFAAAALLLAALGLYGVMAGSVAERVREIGVRSALGASPRRIVAQVVSQGMALTGIGIAIGIGLAAATIRGLGALLYGVAPLDGPTYLAVAALLGVVAAAACSVPAWRAGRVDPSVTLRAE